MRSCRVSTAHEESALRSLNFRRLRVEKKLIGRLQHPLLRRAHRRPGFGTCLCEWVCKTHTHTQSPEIARKRERTYSRTTVKRWSDLEGCCCLGRGAGRMRTGFVALNWWPRQPGVHKDEPGQHLHSRRGLWGLIQQPSIRVMIQQGTHKKVRGRKTTISAKGPLQHHTFFMKLDGPV